MKPDICKGCDEKFAVYRLQNEAELPKDPKQPLPDEILICPFCGTMHGIQERFIQLPHQVLDRT